MLTIVFTTSRKYPQWKWFADSLERELLQNAQQLPLKEIKIIVIDLLASERGLEFHDLPVGELCGFVQCTPKPTPWQGFHRQTQEDWFAASNARNTAIAMAPDGYIAFVDDLSWMMPGWLDAVVAAIAGGYIACGAYRKVFQLKPEPQVTYVDNPHGHDARWRYGRDGTAVPCQGNWMYGCSLAAPVQAFLDVNGYPESCDGMGYEDAVCGLVIQRNGYRFMYDRRMLTLESEEGHAQGPVMRREDPGVSPNDKSHAMLARYATAKRFDNPFDLSEIRAGYLKSGLLEFPKPEASATEWFTGKPLYVL